MTTRSEWQKYFNRLDSEARDKLQSALEVLQSDPMFFKEFGQTGIFSLVWFIKEASLSPKTSKTSPAIEQ